MNETTTTRPELLEDAPAGGSGEERQAERLPGAEATYSPEDDTLRLYTAGQLDQDDYQRVKALRFAWAPRQELWRATWSAAREDLLLEWCGEIGDEGTTMADRAADRAERFEQYSENRTRDAEQAERSVSAIADGIPLGQPILVGHHSERRARKDAERIQRGMERALDNWKTADYWKGRAHGTVAHADYKDRPEVRARRIKKLQADERRILAAYTPSATGEGEPWPDCQYRNGKPALHPRADEHGEPITCELCKRQPLAIVGQGRAKHPVRVSALPAIERAYARDLEHVRMRIVYERAVLEEQGGARLLDKKPRPKQPPLLNYKREAGQVATLNPYQRGEIERLRQVSMTKADYAAIYADRRGTRQSAEPPGHRVRIAIVRRGQPGYVEDEKRSSAFGQWVAVFLTDSKAHEEPTP